MSSGESLDTLPEAERFCMDLMQVLICLCLAQQSLLNHPVLFGKGRPTTAL